MKITALIENYSYKEGIAAQYGLSLLVQTGNSNILVDAGQNDMALNNFLALGYDPSIIDAIVISHNHFDHIGGLQSFLDATAEKAPPVYVSQGVGTDLYSKRLFSRKNLCSRNDLIEQNRHRVQFVSDALQILPNVFVCTVTNPDPDFVCKDRKLRMSSESGRLIRDDFRHEVYLAILEADGLKIVSSCSHNGIVNIARDAADRFHQPVETFVGGLHLRGKHHDTLNCSRAHVKQLVKAINELSIPTIHTCHCTGILGYQLIEKDYLGKIYYFSSGDQLSV